MFLFFVLQLTSLFWNKLCLNTSWSSVVIYSQQLLAPQPATGRGTQELSYRLAEDDFSCDDRLRWQNVSDSFVTVRDISDGWRSRARPMIVQTGNSERR